MPFIFSERLPVPTLKSYCCLSLLIFATSIAYWRNIDQKGSFNDTFIDFIDAIISEPFTLWPLVNMAFCCLFLCGKLIQRMLLGKLRVVEEQHLQEKFWNFIFYKVIFVFGVISAQSLHEVLCWATWFSLLGFLSIFLQLCKDRYEHVTSTPNMTQTNHIKLLVLIFGIIVLSFVLGVLAISYKESFGFNEFAFMLTECILMGLKSLHMFLKYIFQLKNTQHTGLWDNKKKLTYYTNLGLRLIILSADLGFHFHMIIWSNVFVSMASLVLYWNIRSIFSEIKLLLKKHRLYKKILKSVNARIPMANEEELSEIEDHCAICWEGLETARKLPCGHFFHHNCLCSWLEQDISCPTCRRPLSADIGLLPGVHGELAADQNTENEVDFEEVDADNQNNGGGGGAGGGGLRNYFFYLDGQQIANWFPSLSIEVFHGRMGGEQQGDDEINEMAQQLFTMFPNVGQEAIIGDLQRTHSVEATADNILEGLVAPPNTTNAIVREEAPPIALSPEERQVDTNVVMSPVLEPGTDTESDLIEDSSGAEDTASLRRFDGGPFDGARRRAHVNPREVMRRRQVKRTNHTSSTSSEPSTENNPPITSLLSSRDNTNQPITTFPQERDQRRSILLEAIERRYNPSST
eukprot:TCONS_00060600-protein